MRTSPSAPRRIEVSRTDRARAPDRARDAAPATSDDRSTWLTAVVTGQAGHAGVTLRAGQGQPCVARIAASALLVPQTGDTVLVFRDDNGTHWLTQVLRLAPTQETAITRTLAVQDVETLQVSAKHLQLKAEDSFHLQAPLARIQTRSAIIDTELAQISGSHLVVATERLTYVARFVQSVVTHLIQRARTRFSHVELTDTVEAQRIQTRANEVVEIEAHTLDLKAQGPLFLDGEQVMVG